MLPPLIHPVHPPPLLLILVPLDPAPLLLESLSLLLLSARILPLPVPRLEPSPVVFRRPVGLLLI